MPRVEITAEEVDRTTSVQPATVDSDATNDMVVLGGADGLTILEVENVGGSPATLEVVANPALQGPDDLTITNLTITVPAGDVVVRGTFRTSSYKQNANNDLYVNPSVTTDLKIRAYRVALPT